MKHQGWLWGRILILGSFLSLVCITPASTQVLTRAEVDRLQNVVEILRRNQSPTRARQGSVLVPRETLRVATDAFAQLRFNENSVIRVANGGRFYFESGLRRINLEGRPNIEVISQASSNKTTFAQSETPSTLNETIFVLEDGAALIICPPGSVGTQVKTPESLINIASTELPTAPLSDSQSSELLPPLERISVVAVEHNAANSTTQIFALTDDHITASYPSGGNPVPLLGGQTVEVSRGVFGRVREFSLEEFYRSPAGSLAAGLGPGQEEEVAAESEAVQAVLNTVRPNTLAAVRNQIRRFFIGRALNYGDTDFYQQQSRPSLSLQGRFVRRSEGTISNFTFIPDQGQQESDGSPARPRQITVDFDDQTIQIDGESGIDSSAGLSGERGAGTLILEGGSSIRGEIFEPGDEFNEDEPVAGSTRRGSLTFTNPAPDR